MFILLHIYILMDAATITAGRLLWDHLLGLFEGEPFFLSINRKRFWSLAPYATTIDEWGPS